jgi:hypothetical protein
MGRLKINLVLGVVFLQFLSCREHKEHKHGELVDTANKDSLQVITLKKSTKVGYTAANQDSLERVSPKSVTNAPYDSVFLKKTVVGCKLIQSQEQKEDDSFLNSCISFYEVQTLPELPLINEDYCRFVLEKTRFLFFRDSDFSPGYYNFSHFYTRIDGYGECFVGKFYFPSIDNSAQRRAIIILQMDLNEISILNFDDVKFVNGKLYCDLNVRGRHTIFKLEYSKDCKRFVK